MLTGHLAARTSFMPCRKERTINYFFSSSDVRLHFSGAIVRLGVAVDIIYERL